MRKPLSILIGLTLSLGSPLVFAQKESTRADQRRTPDATRIVKLIDSLRRFCAKPKDPFESKQEALSRAMAGFEAPTLAFAIRPMLSRDNVSQATHPGPRGGQIWDATRYKADEQLLSVEFPFYKGGTRRLIKEVPFRSAASPPSRYSFIDVAAEMRNLPSYNASNAFGMAVEVSRSRDMLYLLAFTNPDDLEKLRLSTPEGKKVEAFITRMEPERARAVAPALEWRVKATVQPYEGADCVVDRLEYTNRHPTIDNPWREEIVEYVVPVRLGSVELVDKRNGEVLWSSERAPEPAK